MKRFVDRAVYVAVLVLFLNLFGLMWLDRAMSIRHMGEVKTSGQALSNVGDLAMMCLASLTICFCAMEIGDAMKRHYRRHIRLLHRSTRTPVPPQGA